MTLKDAILVVQDEYDAELKADPNSRQMREAFVREWREIDATGLLQTLTGGANIQPLEALEQIRNWIYIAFRLGMRVQRKLDRPAEATTYNSFPKPPAGAPVPKG